MNQPIPVISPYSISLTTRLALVFALVAGLTFAGVGAYLYRTLALQLEAREDIDLVERMGQIRHFLGETPDTTAILQDPHRFLDAAAWSAGLILCLRAADGTVLLQNHSGLGPWPDLNFIAAGQAPESAVPRTVLMNAGANANKGATISARTIAAWGTLGSASQQPQKAQQQVQVILAHTTAERSALLAAYRSKIFISTLCGALLAALSGYGLVWKGLHPLRQIVQQARAITAERLEMRLEVHAAPPELQVLVQAFNAMLTRLHHSFQRLSQFSGDLAHDLRTPINNLMVQNQVALSKPRTVDEYQSLLVSNVEEYERLSRMVESVLFLARADNAQVALKLQTIDPATELQRIADYFEGVAADAGVTLSVKATGELVADAILFRRAVNNLVANAIAHTAPGGVIELESQPTNTGETSVVTGAIVTAAAVTVTNPGPGIDAEHIPKLFDRFYRVDPARSNVASKAESTATSAGLGLCIVRSIMSLHRGVAEVECTAQGKTVFRLVFPG